MTTPRPIKRIQSRTERLEDIVSNLEKYVQKVLKSNEVSRQMFALQARDMIKDHLVPMEGKQKEFLLRIEKQDEITRRRKEEAECEIIETARTFNDVEGQFLGIHVHEPTDEAGWAHLSYWSSRWEKKLRQRPPDAAEMYRQAEKTGDTHMMYWLETEGKDVLNEVTRELGAIHPDSKRVIRANLELDGLIEESMPEYGSIKSKLNAMEERIRACVTKVNSLVSIDDERRRNIERTMSKDEASITPKILFEAGIGKLFPELATAQRIFDEAVFSSPSDELSGSIIRHSHVNWPDSSSC